MSGRWTGTERRSWRCRAAGLVALVMAATLPGCWFQEGADGGHTRYDPAERGITPANVDTLSVAWSTSVGGVGAEAIVVDGRAVVRHAPTPTSAAVTALDVATGDQLWTTPLDTAQGEGPGSFVLTGPLALLPGRGIMTGFYTASTVDGTSTCETGNRFLDPATGEPVVAGAGGYPLGRAVSGGLVATTVYACGAHQAELQVTGSYAGEAIQWRAALDSALLSQPPIAAGDRVVTADGHGVHGFAAGGCGGPTDCPPLWTSQVFYQGPVATPTGPIWAQAASSAVGLDRDTGEQVAALVLGGAAPDTSTTGLAVDGSQVYVSSGTATTGRVALEAFPASCRSRCLPRWRGEVTGVGVSRPVIGGGVAYVVVADDYDGTNARVLAFAARGCGVATCDPLAVTPVPGRGELSLSDGRLLVSTSDTVTALEAAP